MSIYWILTSQKEVRDYLTSGIHEKMHIFKESFLLIDPDLNNTFREAGNRIQLPQFSKLSVKCAAVLALANLYRCRDRTVSHLLRAESLFFPERAQTSVVVYSWTKLSFRQRFIARVISKQIFFLTTQKALNLILYFESKRFRRKVKFKKNDIVVLAYTGALNGQFDLTVQMCKFLNLTSVAYQSNWDNLSSKTFIRVEPDFFCVWGEQSASHLREIQRLKSSQVFVVGSPRFNTYFWESAHSKTKVDKTNDGEIRVFVAGTGDGIDDDSVINQVLQALFEIRGQKNIVLFYRPHPFNRSPKRQEALVNSLRNINWCKTTVLVENVDTDPLESYLPYLTSADLVCSHLSTICLESLLLGVPVCVPLFQQEVKDFDWARALDTLEHYKGLRLVKGFLPAPDQESLTLAIQKAISGDFVIGSDLSWICTGGIFSEKMVSVLAEILLIQGQPC